MCSQTTASTLEELATDLDDESDRLVVLSSYAVDTLHSGECLSEDEIRTLHESLSQIEDIVTDIDERCDRD